MKIIAVFFTLFLVSGCASKSSQPATTDTPPEVPVADPAAPDPGANSRILGKKKCPPHSSLVNGTCVLDVESDQ